MQAITSDIIVNQIAAASVSNLQLSQNINNSQKSTAISFEDLVRSYSKPVENTDSGEKTQVVENRGTEEISKNNDSKEVQKNEGLEKKESALTEKKSEKVSVKEESGKEKSVKNASFEVKKDDKISSVKAKIDVKDVVPAKETKTEPKINNPKVSNEKKSKKEFNRMDELLDKTGTLNLSDNNSNLAAVISEIPQEQNSLNPKDVSDQKNQKVKNQTADITINNVENSSFEKVMDEDFGKMNGSEVKIHKLDKEGKITVADYRTEKDLDSEKVEKLDSELKSENLKTEVKIDSKDSATITMNLENQSVEENVLSLNSQTAASEGSNYQAMLSNQIQNNAPDFVKAGNIILKDNNQGTINLVLHPDDLGNVKIHLSLDGKTISAQITVATKEAMEVFKDNAQTLREAFIQSGFEAAEFNVSYNDSSSSGNNNFREQMESNVFTAKRMYEGESTSVSEIDSYDGINENFSNYSINIVA